MPTPREAKHIRLSERDVENLRDGEVIVEWFEDETIVIDAAPTNKKN